jgi:glycosyltransferase involved in cell wall biosynthesis
MKKIKVLQIVPMLSPGGAERVAVHIVRGLNRQRYEPMVVSFTERMNCDLDDLLDEAGIETRYLGKHPGFDYRVYPRLQRVLSECQPDVVHTHLHVLRYALPCVIFPKKASWLHTVHNMAEREVEPRARWIQRCAYRRGVVPVAVAERVAESMQRLYGIQGCRVIANGIPTDGFANPRISRQEWRAKEGFAETDILFVCVARFAPQKNHRLLLNAFAQGPASNPNAHLVLVGEGVLQQQLEEQTKALHLTSQVHFLGLRADIPEVLGAGDIFVLSSDWEGNPLSILEAMAAGLPIVSTAVGGVPDLFENGKEGLIVPSGDTPAFSKAMVSLVVHSSLRKSLGKAAADRAKGQFDVSLMVRAYEELYETLIADPQRVSAEDVIQTATVSGGKVSVKGIEAT